MPRMTREDLRSSSETSWPPAAALRPSMGMCFTATPSQVCANRTVWAAERPT